MLGLACASGATRPGSPAGKTPAARAPRVPQPTRLEAAHEQLRKARAEHGETSRPAQDAYRERAAAYFQANDTEAARADVARAIEIAERDGARDEAELAELLGELAWYELTSRAFDSAKATIARAVSLAERLDRKASLAGYLRTQARAQSITGARKEAEATARRALALDLALNPKSLAVADDRETLGDVLLAQGRLDEAIAEFRQSIALQDSQLKPTDPQYLRFTNSVMKIANVFARARDLEQARRLYERVIAMHQQREGKDSFEAALITVQMVNLLLLAPEIDGPALLRRLEPAITTLEKAKAPRSVLRPAQETGPKILFRMNVPGARASARKLYEDFAAEDLRTGDLISYASSQQKLGLSCMSQNDRDCALRALEEGVETQRKLRPGSLSLGLSQAVLADGYYFFGEYEKAIDQYAAALEATVERGGAIVERQRTPLDIRVYLDALWRAGRGPKPEGRSAAAAGLMALQLEQQSLAALAVARLAERTRQGQGELSGLIRRAQDLHAERARLESAFAEALNTAGAQDAGQLAKVRERLATVDEATGVVRAELAKHADYQALTAPPVRAPELLQSQLEPGELLLAFHFSGTGSFVWALSRAGLSWAKLDLTDVALATEVRALRATLAPEGARGLKLSLASPSPPPFDRARAHRLYQKLFGQLAQPLAGAKRLLVVPSGPLEALPLGVLVTSAPATTSASSEDTAWLIRDKAILVLPSISSLGSLRRGHATRPRNSFIGIGNPSIDPRAQAKGLYPLEFAEGELRQLLGTLGSGQVLLGAGASEEAVKALPLAAYRVVAFSTHGLTARETELLAGIKEPALLLSAPLPEAREDGFLTASEVAALELGADWVVLSACNTAAGDGSTREEALSGLARAFFYAGARSLLVSHWSVYDTAAFDLTTKTFSLLRRRPSLGRAEALQQAMLATMREPLKGDPAYWAPFSLVGDGGAR